MRTIKKQNRDHIIKYQRTKNTRSLASLIFSHFPQATDSDNLPQQIKSSVPQGSIAAEQQQCFPSGSTIGEVFLRCSLIFPVSSLLGFWMKSLQSQNGCSFSHRPQEFDTLMLSKPKLLNFFFFQFKILLFFSHCSIYPPQCSLSSHPISTTPLPSSNTKFQT